MGEKSFWNPETAKSFKEGTSLGKGELKEALEDYSAPFERSIGLIGVIISLSAMLGSGLFVLPALAADSMSNHGTSGFGEVFGYPSFWQQL